MQNFVHLHVHSQYSILDGQASIARLVDKAMADGMPGIALTDHGNMFGVKEFYNYVKKQNGKRRDKIKDLKKKSEMTEDEAKASEKSCQDLTDKYIKELDKVTEKKNKEIMEI